MVVYTISLVFFLFVYKFIIVVVAVVVVALLSYEYVSFIKSLLLLCEMYLCSAKTGTLIHTDLHQRLSARMYIHKCMCVHIHT